MIDNNIEKQAREHLIVEIAATRRRSFVRTFFGWPGLVLAAVALYMIAGAAGPYLAHPSWVGQAIEREGTYAFPMVVDKLLDQAHSRSAIVGKRARRIVTNGIKDARRQGQRDVDKSAKRVRAATLENLDQIVDNAIGSSLPSGGALDWARLTKNDPADQALLQTALEGAIAAHTPLDSRWPSVDLATAICAKIDRLSTTEELTPEETLELAIIKAALRFALGPQSVGSPPRPPRQAK